MNCNSYWTLLRLTVKEFIDDYALRLGAIAGVVIPRTKGEDDLMGDQSDHLVDETKDKADQLLETGKEVGARVLETVKEEAREQGLTGETVASKLSDLADRGGQIPTHVLVSTPSSNET